MQGVKHILKWILQSGFRVSMIITAAVMIYHVASELAVLGGRPPNFHQRLELTALDVKFAARGTRRPKEWKVAIAAADEKAISALGRLPWSRGLHARLVDRLTELRAASIAFDILFEPPSADEGAALREISASAKRAGLFDEPAELRRQADELEAVERALSAVPRLKKEAASLRAPILRTRELASSLETFSGSIGSLDRSAGDPDREFADAIRRSGRVVLGVVALSRREADLIGLTNDQLLASLRVVGSSTITELVEPGGSALAKIFDAREAFRTGFYRRYFGVVAPPPVLAEATEHFAMLNAAPDHDGVNRRLPLLGGIRDTGTLIPALALKAVQVAHLPSPIEVLGYPDELSPRGVRIGGLLVETELGASSAIDWYGHFEDMPVLSIADILDGKVAQNDVKDRIVFVAATAIGTYDQRVTPLERAVAGVYIHAMLAQNIMDGRQLTRPAHVIAVEVLLFLVLGLLAGLVMTRFDVPGQTLIALLMAGGWILVDELVLFDQGLAVYTVLPVFQVSATLLALALRGFFWEQRERRKTKQAFGRYLAPRVMEQVLSDPEEYLRLGGRRYEATVLFSDIRGFTTISESLTPEALGHLLNKYMTPMTDIVFRHDGTLDKYIGDAVMAFWGAPLAQENHALLACRAALEMMDTVVDLNVAFAKEGLPEIAIGIGLSTGPMTIGNMGSDDHFSYTALGDRVNLGSRLEGQTKDYGVGIILSDACHEMVKDEMLCRELGALRVKGKREPVRIYELVGPRAEHAAENEFVELFHHGLGCFRARKWDEAIERFSRALTLRGGAGDKTTAHYLEWCAEYRQNPPPEDWDGVRVATSK